MSWNFRTRMANFESSHDLLSGPWTHFDFDPYYLYVYFISNPVYVKGLKSYVEQGQSKVFQTFDLVSYLINFKWFNLY